MLYPFLAGIAITLFVSLIVVVWLLWRSGVLRKKGNDD